MITLDCRNLTCPAPVIAVKKALEENTEFRVFLDDGAPRENVERFCRNRGFQVAEERYGNGWALTIMPFGERLSKLESPVVRGEKILLIGSDSLGDGPEELGRLLLKNFIHTLLEVNKLPDRIVFLNTGVFLTAEGSDVLEALDKLENMGVDILSCGLCLDFFMLKSKLKVGITTNMLSIAESLLTAQLVIRI